MHWLLDVHFGEDFCRIEDIELQKNMSIFRKVALNVINQYKSETKTKKPISKIMLNCLVDVHFLKNILTFWILPTWNYLEQKRIPW